MIINSYKFNISPPVFQIDMLDTSSYDLTGTTIDNFNNIAAGDDSGAVMSSSVGNKVDVASASGRTYAVFPGGAVDRKYLTGDLTFFPLTNNYTMVVVFKPTSVTSGTQMITFTDNDNPNTSGVALLLYGDKNRGFDSGTYSVDNGTADITLWQISILSYTPNGCTMSVNNTGGGAILNTTVSFNGLNNTNKGKMFIGGWATTQLPFYGHLGEVRVYNEVFDSTDLDTIATELKTKWNIT